MNFVHVGGGGGGVEGDGRNVKSELCPCWGGGEGRNVECELCPCWGGGGLGVREEM